MNWRSGGRGPGWSRGPDLFQTASEFTLALQALSDRSGLTIREVARLADGRVATVGDYVSGRHLPLDRELFAQILAVFGESDLARVERWQLALARAGGAAAAVGCDARHQRRDQGALTRTAEQACESLAEDQRKLARQLFLRWCAPPMRWAPSRASVALGDLPGWGQAGDAERVLASFVGERMITVDADAAQITHDALLAACPGCGLGSTRTPGSCATGAGFWTGPMRGSRPVGEKTALWRGSRLALAREWAADVGKRTALPGQALSSADACVAAADAGERAAPRRTRWLQSTVRPGSCNGSPSARVGGCWRRQATTGRCGCGTWRCPGGRC
jgi:hypothetical protein